MMKFFRKYNKQMLAVMMVALMVVFIGGSALQSLMTPQSNSVVAHSKFGPITQVDQQSANEATRLLEAMGLNWKQPFGAASDPIEPVDWILLLREAKVLGTDVGPDAVRSTLGDPNMEQQVSEVSRRMRVKPDAVLQALADLRTIQRTVSAIGGSTTPSEAQLQIAARNALESVSIRAIVAPAKAFVDEKQTFSDEEIKAQFAAYRDKERGEGLNFGYYRAPSVKVQFITIDHAAIASAVGVANLESKSKAYYEQQKKLNDPAYLRPPAASADPAAPPPDPYLSYEEAKDKAIDGLRKQHATEAAARLADWIAQFTAEPFFEIERGKNGYKPAPSTVARLEYYDELVQRIPSQLTFPKAVAISETGFFTIEEASSIPELGSAGFQASGGVRQSFPGLVFRNESLVPQVPEDDRASAADYLALFQTCPVSLTDSKTGNLYLFRVVGSKAGYAPESVDEVRDVVIADLRTLRGYEAAKKRAESLKQHPGVETLKGAAEADAELTAFKSKPEGVGSGYFEPAPLTRVPRFLAYRGRDPKGISGGLGLGRLPNDAVDAIFALERAEDKTKVIELKDRATVLVVQWVETKLAAEEEFKSLRKQLVQQLAETNWKIAVGAWLDPKQVRARAGFDLRRN